jgi:hypothetical protein
MIVAWPRMAGIADFRLPIAPPWRADGHWKGLPHYLFNRQSARRGGAMKTRPLLAAVLRCHYYVGEYVDAPRVAAGRKNT